MKKAKTLRLMKRKIKITINQTALQNQNKNSGTLYKSVPLKFYINFKIKDISDLNNLSFESVEC